MELKAIFVHSAGAYLAAYDRPANRWVGAFCWSCDQIIHTMQRWSVTINQVIPIAADLNNPQNAVIPKTHARQPIFIEGTVAAKIAQQFEVIKNLVEMGVGKQLVELPPPPPARIVGCLIDASDKAHQNAILYYTDPNGTPNMVIIRNQLQGLTVLSFSWINDDQRATWQNFLQHLPVMGDDDLDVPTLVQGDIIKLLIAGIIVHANLASEAS